MVKTEFKSIDAISQQYEMSQVWLHQLRLTGQVETKCIKNIWGKQFILWNIEDVDKWVKEHPEIYKKRRKEGYFDRVSKTNVLPDY